MAWRPARSLEVLLAQLNTRYPNRKKASDGALGDAAHAARKSDHNPDNRGIVRARDFTHDRATGINCHQLAYALQASKDSRIKYIIWNKKIMGGLAGPAPWKWRDYKGSNPHTKHLHLSVIPGDWADAGMPWDLSPLDKPWRASMSEVFNLSTNTAAQRAVIEGALARCDFPWERILPGLKAETRRDVIPVTWADLRSIGALGLAYYDGRIVLEKGMVLADPELAGAVFLAEGSHMTDFFYLTDAHREAIWDAYHALDEDIGGHGHDWFEPTSYYSQMGETYMIGFVEAFAPSYDTAQWGFTHGTTPEIAAQVRAIVLEEAAPMFNDIAGHWAQGVIEQAAALGFVAGYEDGTFRPDQPTTRAEVVAFLMRVYDALRVQPAPHAFHLGGARIIEAPPGLLPEAPQ